MLSTTKPSSKISESTVHSFYYAEFDQNKGSNSGVVIDDACYELMFVKEKNVKLINGGSQTFLLPPSYTLNNLKGPFKFDYDDSFSSFCIKLQPWMNASYIPTKKSQLLDLNQLYPQFVDPLHKNLFASASFEEMVEHAEEFLLSINVVPNKEVELIRKVCLLIYQESGNITVGEIADQFNIYRQRLSALFKQEVKYTIKKFINCIRIRACLAYKLINPEISLTEIGHRYGFYDQAHFIRSFKQACGITPSAYVKTPGYSLEHLQSKK